MGRGLGKYMLGMLKVETWRQATALEFVEQDCPSALNTHT